MKTKILNLDSGREPIILLNKDSELVKKEGFSPLARVKIFDDSKYAYATLYLTETEVKNDEVGLSKKIQTILGAKDGEEFDIKHMEPLLSFSTIRDKLRGKPFTEEGIYNVIKDDQEVYCGFCF